MATKKKPKASEIEALAASVIPVTSKDGPILEWPEAFETRDLYVSLSDDERIERALQMIAELGESTRLAEEKKAKADEYKAKIEAQEEKVSRSQEIVLAGKERKKVSCRWIFQANGIDDLGNPVFHSEMKTLIREDTGAYVEAKPITQEDRQINLPLGNAETQEVNEQRLLNAGWALEETPPGSVFEEPWTVRTPDGLTHGIVADCRADAAAAAAALLPEPDDSEGDSDDEGSDNQESDEAA